MKLRYIAILNIEGYDYCIIIRLITKNRAVDLIQNAYLTKKRNIIGH